MLTAKELLGCAQALEPQLVEWRRTLHRHPEVGFDLTQTKALVKKALTEMGYAPQDCGRCGVLALAGGKRPGKCACRQRHRPGTYPQYYDGYRPRRCPGRYTEYVGFGQRIFQQAFHAGNHCGVWMLFCHICGRF